MSRHLRTHDDSLVHLLIGGPWEAEWSLADLRIVCGANVRVLFKDGVRCIENATFSICANLVTCEACGGHPDNGKITCIAIDDVERQP